MRKELKISSAVIRRLPKYYRYLGLIMKTGTVRVSSQELSEITGFTASQIRQDLNHFGGFGQQGYGYNVKELRAELKEIIGLNLKYKVCIIGVGNIGKAIFNYYNTSDSSLDIVACFDADLEKSSSEVGKITKDIGELDDFLKHNEIDIAVLATPVSVAQEIANKVVDNGVKAIWNFAPIDLKLPDKIVLEDVHLDESLSTLIYYLGNIKDYKGNRQ